MQELIVFLETPDSSPKDNFKPHFGSPEKICNTFLNRCVIDEDAGFEIAYISYLNNFAEMEEYIQRLSREHSQNFSRTMRHSDNFGRPVCNSNCDLQPLRRSGPDITLTQSTNTFLTSPEKDLFDMLMLDIALVHALHKYAKKSDCIPHIVYAGYRYYQNEDRLYTLLLEQLKKHSIFTAMMTNLFMYKNYLMTREKMEKFFDLDTYSPAMTKLISGEHVWTPRESINDNLEEFVEKLNQALEQEHYSETYFVSKLTEEEKKLFTEKDEKHMNTYLAGPQADVKEDEMNLSLAKSKYLRAQCWRTTLMVKNYELSQDDYYYFEFKNDYETIHVDFCKHDMTYIEMESLAKFSWSDRHAWATQAVKYLQRNNLDFAELSSMDFVNPYREKLINDGWEEAIVSLSRPSLEPTIFLLSVFKDAEKFPSEESLKSFWRSSHAKTLYWNLLIFYLAYCCPKTHR